MINNLTFWRNWPTYLKVPFLAILAIFTGLLILLSFSFLYENDFFFRLAIASELMQKFVSIPAFSERGLTFSNNELVYYIKQYYLTDTNFLPQWFSNLYFGGMLLALSLMLAAHSHKSGFWFLFNLIVTASFLISLRTENLLQRTDNLAFLIVFLLIGLVMFSFQWLAGRFNFIKRWLILLFVLVLLFGLLISISQISLPVLALSSHTLYFGVVVFFFLLLGISHMSMGGIVWLVSNGLEKGKSSWRNYLIGGSFYLLNCLLIYLEHIRALDGGAAIISPLVLFIVTLIVGIWGFRKMAENSPQFEGFANGAWALYLGAGLVAILVLIWAKFTANDPLLELLYDMISITHLVMGLVFFVHVAINFSGLFKNGYNVYLVMYKPKINRLILAQTLGFFLVVLLLVQKNLYAYSQLRAADYNAVADYYWAAGDYLSAETYYKNATHHDLYNHKSNASLAGIAEKMGDGVNAAFFYKQALVKNPSVFAYIGLSNKLEKEDLYFDALFNMREANIRFSDSEPVYSNMARLLSKSNNRDSAYLYLEKAYQKCKNCEVAQSNLQAFWIENTKAESLDSVSKNLKNDAFAANLANQKAIGLLSGKLEKNEALKLNLKALNVAEFAQVYNTLLADPKNLPVKDSLLIQLAYLKENQGFQTDLMYLQSLVDYHQNNKIPALKQLTYLSQDTTQTALMYRRKVGMMYLQEGIFERGSQFLIAGNDASSASLLEKEGFKAHLEAKQKLVAHETIQAGLNLENYQKILADNPFNTYLLVESANLLEKANKQTEAYKLIFDALEFNDTSVELWKKQAVLGIKLGVPDYAAIGQQKLKDLLPADDYKNCLGELAKVKAEMAKKAADFQ